MQLERGAKAASKLSDPYICTLHDICHLNGLHYLVMELLTSRNSGAAADKRGLTAEQTIRYGAQIANALAGVARPLEAMLDRHKIT